MPAHELDPGRSELAETPRRLPLTWRLALLLLAPLVLIGPSLLPGMRFLPQAPVLYEPLASEYPEAARRAAEGMNHWTGDRIFPVLADQRELRQRLFAGRGWLHDARSGLGQPLLGNAIHGPLYPPNLLLLALPPERAAGPLAILALVLAGAGLWALLARLGLHDAACAFAAVALQGVGWGVANLHYGMKVDAALWLPWCLWAVEGLRARDRRAGAWLSAFVACSCLAGFPPIAAFTLGAAGLAALVRLRRPAALAGFAGALAIGVACAGLQLGPTLQASAQSYRTPKDSAALAAEASAPGASLGLVAPALFGRPTEPPAPFGPVAAWWVTDPDQWERVQTAVALEWDPYAGVVVVLLAAVGVLTGGRRAWLPAALLLLSLGFAQGWPGARLLYGLPGLDAGSPTRALSVAWIAWPWLAAVGLDRALTSSRDRRLALWAATAVGLLAAGLAVAFADGRALIASQERILGEAHGRSLEAVRQVLPVERSERAATRLAEGLTWLTGAALALAAGALVARNPRRRLAVVAAPGLVLAAELLTYSPAHVRPRDLGGVELFPPSATLDAIRDATGQGRTIRFDPTPAGLEHVQQLARPNLPWAYGIADVSSYVAFTPRATVDWFAAVDPRTRVRSGVGRLPSLESLEHPNLDAARVTSVLSLDPLVHPRLEPVLERPRFHVYRRLLDAEVTAASLPRPSYVGAGVGAALSLIGLLLLGLWARASRRPEVES